MLWWKPSSCRLKHKSPLVRDKRSAQYSRVTFLNAFHKSSVGRHNPYSRTKRVTTKFNSAKEDKTTCKTSTSVSHYLYFLRVLYRDRSWYFGYSMLVTTEKPFIMQDGTVDIWNVILACQHLKRCDNSSVACSEISCMYTGWRLFYQETVMYIEIAHVAKTILDFHW